MIKTVGPDAGPIVEEYKQKMSMLAGALDKILNGEERPKKIGFCLLMFPFSDASHPSKDRLNYISNADALDIKAMFKEMIARFEHRWPAKEHKT